MQQKWFLIINPNAGGGKGRKHWKSIEKLLLNLGLDYDFVFSQAQGQAVELAREAVLKGYRHIVAVGGDGTANEVVNGLFSQNEVDSQSLYFGIIPVGTGNDWIKTHKIPPNYKKAIILLKAKHSVKQDLGKVSYVDAQGQPGERYFINVAGMGYDAFVTKASNESPRMTNSRLFYLYLILSCTTKYKSIPARVIFDGQVEEGDFYSMAIGQCIYNGGGAQFVPHAKPDDGLFALTLVRPVSIMDVVFNSRKFYNGRITEHPQVSTYQVKNLRVEAIDPARPTGLEVDGEFLGYTPVEFTMLPAALNIIVP